MISLTFDTDHVDDARMREFLDRVPVPGTGTFFLTRLYPSLAGGPHELCPHPNLEPGSDWEAELARWREALPQARGWRSHSCVFSHRLAERLARDGYLYLSTHDEFGRSGLRPHRHGWGIWHMPIFYMDTLDLFAARFWKDHEHVPFAGELVERALDGRGVYVFDFHPVHLLLNSPTPEWYLEKRDGFRAGEDLTALRFDGYGVRSFYDDLCSAMRRRGEESVAAVVALERFVRER